MFPSLGVASVGGIVGAKTGMIAFSDGELIDRLVGASEPDPHRTEELVELILPGWPRSSREGNTLHDGTYPPEDVVYAGSFAGVDVVCSRSLMLDRPSELPPCIVKAAKGRTLRPQRTAVLAP